MRIFLIIFSFIDAIIYIFIYSYFDKILEILGSQDISPAAVNFIKLAALLIVGLCIGSIVMLILRLKIKKSFFSFTNLLIVGIFPFACLILSEGAITSFVINKFFNSSEKLSELAFYLFSRQAIWSLWLGFDVGSSIRFSFYKYRHISIQKTENASPEPFKASDIKKQDHNHRNSLHGK